MKLNLRFKRGQLLAGLAVLLVTSLAFTAAFAQSPFPPTPTPPLPPTPTATLPATPPPTATATATPPHEDTGGIQGCTDGIDNDGDGLIDCADSDCANAPPCVPIAPLLSSGMLAVVVVALGSVGLLAMWRMRRTPRGFGPPSRKS